MSRNRRLHDFQDYCPVSFRDDRDDSGKTTGVPFLHECFDRYLGIFANFVQTFNPARRAVTA
jgi:hypothetical protein